MNAPLLVNFTPTGMLPMKPACRFVPVTPAEIIHDVQNAWDIGITSVHLHARDPQTGEPTYHKEVFREIILGIRSFAPELVITVSTSGRKYPEFAQRAEVLDLTGDCKPDMASLTLSSLNFNNVASLNAPEMIQALAQRMCERGIKPELEAFDAGMINYARYLHTKGLLSPPYCFSLILGNVACAQASLLSMGMMETSLPEDSIIQMGGIGRYQLQVNAIAVAAGHGVRIGLEDNYWYDRERTRQASNTMLLTRLQTLAAAAERRVMTPSQLRALLHLKPGNGAYGC